jgi:hypothetical protein
MWMENEVRQDGRIHSTGHNILTVDIRMLGNGSLPNAMIYCLTTTAHYMRTDTKTLLLGYSKYFELQVPQKRNQGQRT